MAVTVEDVRGVARLARLAFSAAEEERLVGELNRILRYMERLNELDTSEVEPTSYVVPMAADLRADDPVPFPSPQRLVEGAPRHEDGYFRVPRILD
ncbi:MAG: Asp-tRNA(Asn)/Glu-tRNA(Gln) amidotransferase subunit GatC [Candidatus Latescibacterota bacterium]|jgi:aspartyl-tRNA(Asn)/glutamyl-tRNA(Gln) amidotransferase subunit C